MQINQVAGIVAEYNPFHNGHEWMVNQLRRQGCKTIVGVMSGEYVQRAEMAQFPLPVRTKAALAGGVDLVLRLPTPYAISSAERFAQGAVGILAALGCVDVIAFGAENPNVGELELVARLLQSEEFSQMLKVELKKENSYAAARANAVERLLPGAGQVLNSPNNILGVEYCKALQGAVPSWLNSLHGEQKIVLPSVLALPRQGAQHDGEPVNGVASASWLRESQLSGEEEGGLQNWVPEKCFPIYQQALANGEVVDRQKEDFALLARLKGKSAFAFAPYAGNEQEGLAVRLEKAVQKAQNMDEVYAHAKSKRFAHSRIRRILLATALQMPEQLPKVPPFIQVLGANEHGLSLLKKAKKTAVLPVRTSLAKLARGVNGSAEIAEFESKVEDLYGICLQTPRKGGSAFVQPAFIMK